MTKQTPLEIAVAALERIGEAPDHACYSFGGWARAALAAIRSAPVEPLADDAAALKFCTAAATIELWSLNKEERFLVGQTVGNTFRAIDAYRLQQRGGK